LILGGEFQCDIERLIGGHLHVHLPDFRAMNIIYLAEQVSAR
jgi:hypothetical protein